MQAFDSETINRAELLWSYMASFRSAAPCDAVVVCCSYDLRVCDFACDLVNSGLSRRLIMSGKTGNWTRHLWTRSEAAVFKERALENGVPESAVLLEDRSTNFGENIAFTRALLPDSRAITFVTKPAAVATPRGLCSPYIDHLRLEIERYEVLLLNREEVYGSLTSPRAINSATTSNCTGFTR